MEVDLNTFDEAPSLLGNVLIVDDSPIIAASLSQALKNDFVVEAVGSGEACLEYLTAHAKTPTLILLDIDMPGIDGFETCQRLRADHDMPVIFVSSYDDLPERIKAFDSGGDDFVVKPFDPEVLLRKARRIVQHYSEKKLLAAEKENLSSMAMGFLRNLGDTGVLLTFMRSSLGISDYQILAQRLIEATSDYGVSCHVQVRFGEDICTMTPEGYASPLEESVLEKSVAMGRIFQFGRRMVVNYTAVSILIIDAPADETEAGKLRDNIVILAETAEAIAETIGMRKESALRAEALQAAVSETSDAVDTLRELLRKQQSDAYLRLHTMIDNVEKSYVNLGLTDRQEARVSSIVRDGAESTLELFNIDTALDDQFTQIQDALRPQGASSGQSEVW
jgi:CheY-like chemotaxis protein